MYFGRGHRRTAAYVVLFTLVAVPAFALFSYVVTRAAGGTVGTGDCAVTVADTSTVEVISADGKCIYKFTGGTNSFTPPVTNSKINFLLVGGGGGGGSNRGGGGGAGGFYESSWTYTSGLLNVTVGAGGSGGAVPTSNVGEQGGYGGNSSVSGGGAIFMAGGGGGGGAHSVSGSGQNGVAGRSVQSGWTGPSGSGGGASMNFMSSTWSGGAGYSGSDGYGNAGGGSGTLAEPTRNTGGGGGAGGAGIAGAGGDCSATAGTKPDGGLGRTSSITGTLLAYAGGGGGADSRGHTETCSGPDTARLTSGNGAGGAGGGGAGATLSGAAGTGVANVGGGGGGGNSDSTVGGDGGSGVVILSVDLSKPMSSGTTSTDYLPKVTNTVSVAYTATDTNSVSSVSAYYTDYANLQSYTQCGTVSGLSGTSVTGNITCTLPSNPSVSKTYFIFTRATDASGNVEDVPTVGDDSFVSDAVAPLSTPTITPIAVNSTSVSVAYSATDDASLTSVQVYLTANSGYTGGTVCATISVSGTSASGTATCSLGSPTNGTTYYVYTVATDAAGQTEATANQTDGDSVKYDTTKPVLSNGPGPTSVKSSASFSITSSETGTLYIVSNSVTVTNVASITSANDNQFNSVASAGAGVATSVAATGLAEGTYNVYAADDAGNLSTVYTFTIKVDDTAPATPTALAMLLASDAGLSYTDGITNVASPFIEFSVSEREGSVTLTAVKGASTVTCSAGLIAGGTSKPFCQLASLADGTWTVTAVQTDSAGNASPTSSSYSFIIDTVASAAPTGVDLLTDWDYGPGSTDNVTNASYPRFTATKPETTGRIDLKMVQSAVTTYTCSFVETDVDQFCALEPTNGNTTATVSAQFTDVAGNASAWSSTLTVTFDRTAPTLTVSTLSAIYGITQTVPAKSNEVGRIYVAQVNVWTWSDLMALPANQRAFNSETVVNTNINIPLTTMADCGYCAVYATDTAGNISAASSTFSIDATGPTVTYVDGISGSFKATSTVTIKVHFSENVVVTGTPRVYTSVGLYATYASGTGTDTLTFTLTVPSAVNSADLNYNATSSLDLGSGGTATIKDAVANNAVLTLPALTAAESLASQSDIIIDTTAPTVTWATPSPQFTNGSSMDFAITMSEQITGLSPVSFSNTGTATGCNFIYTDMADGIHFTLNVYNCGTGTVIPKLAASGVSDLAGNANAASTSTTTATIDRTAPVVSACTCGKVSGVQNTGTAVTANSTGWIYFVSSTITVTDVASITSQADNLWNAQSVVASTSTNILGSGLLEGTYRVYAVDLAGNLSAVWASGTVTVDNVAPTFSVVGGTYGNGNVVKTTSSEIGVVWFVHNSVVPPSTVTAAWLSTATGWTDKRLTANIATANTATNSQSFCTNPPCSQTSGVYNAYAVDSAGNVSAVLTSVFTLDVTSPTVVSVSSSSPNGKYLYGQTINIDVTFSEPMSSTASAFVSIETGAVNRTAYYSSGNGTNTLTFLYTVQAGDVSSDLDLVNGTVWKGSGLSDMYGNGSQEVGSNFTGLPVGSSTAGSISYAKDIQVDGIVPTVTAVNSASGAGPFTTTFTFSLDVTDFDIADITRGGTATGCNTSLTATSATVYVLTYTGCSNGTVTATVRVDAALLPSGNTGPKAAYTTATIVSDTTPPTITPSASIFYFNSTTPTNFTSNEVATVYLVNTSVTVTDVASITSAATNLRTSYNWTTGTTSVTGAGLVDGAYKFYGVDAYGNMSAASTNTYYLDTVAPTPTLTAASYKIGGSASAQSNEMGTLYLVKSTVTVTNLASITGASASNKVSSSVVAVDTNQSIALTGLLDGTYYAYAVDRANNLSLVSANSITLDNTAPTITNVTAASSDGNYKIGQTILIDVLFSEVVNVSTTGGTPSLLLETGTTDRTSTYLSGSGTNTLRFTYTVQTGDVSTDLNYQSTTALALNSGVIADAAGNNATLTLPALANAASLASRSAINVKGTIMTVSSSTAPSTPTNVTNLSYSITFNETVYGLDASDFTFAGTATGCSVGTLTINATIATVPVTGCSDGTVILKLPASSVADFAGNAAPTADYTFATITVDRTAPTVTISGPTSPTNASSIVFTATFSENISGLAIGDFTRSGTATGCSAGTVSTASGTSATVTFTGCGEGTISLTQSANSVTDNTSNTGPSSAVASSSITIDRTKPSVSSFVPASSYTNAASPVFVLTFSESITGLTTNDFTYSGSATGCTFTPDSFWGTVFNVTASGCSEGTVTPTLVINGVSDPATNTGPAAAFAGSALTIDRTAPTASAAPAVVAGSDTGISSTDGKTNLTSVSVGATTPEATGTLTITATLGATTYTCQTNVVASSGSCSFTGLTEGTWSISTVFTDVAGNDSVSSTISTFTVDTTAPTVTIASPSSPIYSLPTTYIFTFSESITGFTAADVSNNSGTATGCVLTPASSSGTVISVSVSSCSNGTIDLKLAASSIADVAGNAGPAADEIVSMATIDNGPPVVTLATATVKNTANATVQSSKPSTVYVVKSTVSVSVASDITNAADSSWNSVNVSAANTDTTIALTGLSDGTYYAYGVDPQNRVSVASTNSITVDNTAPVAPTSVALLAASDTGTSNSDGITKNNAPTVKVVASEAGGTITVTATKIGETNVVCTMAGSTTGSTCDLTTLVDGTWTISATQTDTATNLSSSSSATIVIDTVAPTVSNVTSNAVNGAKKVGVAINVQVVFDSTVRVDSTGGTPSILMETGATDRAAPYASTLTTVVNFTYTVQTGDTSSDLDYASANAISLNGGAITDIAGNAATTTLPTPGSTGSLSDAKALVIDTIAPNAPVSVALYSLSDSGSSNSDGITNDNTPTIKVVASEVGGTVTVTASKAGQTSVTCSMTGSVIGSTCDLSTLIDGTWTLAATQTDAATNASTSASGSLHIDTVAAAILSVSSNTTNGAKKAGASIDVRVTFDSDIWVDTTNGSPTLTLETGATDRDAAYTSTATTVITFNYTVQAGDTNADLDYASTSAFALNGAVITDVAGNIITTPTLPTPGTAGSLGDAKALVIDTTAPTAPTSVVLDSSSDSGSSNSDGITNDTTPTIKVVAAETAGTVTVTATKAAQSDVVCTVTGSTTGSTCDLATLVEGAWTLTATQTDAAGNVSSSVTGSLTIDTTAAVISSVSSNDANGSYKTGAVVGVRVTFDSAIFMNTTGGSPTLTLETGSTDRNAAYTATTTPVVLFEYTVQAGDTSSDLDYASTSAFTLNGAVITDIAGNITTTPTLPTPGASGSLGNAKALMIDTTAPSTPTSVVLATSSDSGSSNSDGITNDNTPSIKVVASEPGGTITVTASKNGQADVACTMGGSTTGSTCDLATLIDGTWTLVATHTDVAGNVSSNASGSVQIDTVAAAISNVSSNTANGSKKAGASIDVRVTFDSSITMNITGGSPKLTLETGVIDRDATYTSTANPVIIFNYTVQAGDASADLDYVASNSFALNGAVIADVAGNVTIAPTLPTPGATGSLGNAKALVIDTIAPSAPTSVVLATSSDSGSSNSDGITNDNTPTIRVVAAEDGGTVTVTASKVGQSDVTCTAVGSTTGSTCDLSAIVDGSWTLTALQSDAAGNDSGSVAGAFSIDTVAAVVSGVNSNTSNGPRNAGNVIDIRVTFDSEINVNVTGGSPTLLMEAGATDRNAVYASTTSPVVVFTYTVQSGDTSADLDYVATNSFALNGAIITDIAGNASTPVLPTPGATGSLANAKAIVIDTAAPTAPTLTTATMKNTANATVQAAEISTAYLVKSTVTVSTLSSITSAVDNVWNQVSITSINTATSLAATGLIDGTYRAYVSDDAGNVSPSSANSVTIDTTAPVVAISASPSSVASGGTSTFTFTISETTTGFTASDVTVGLGVLSNFTGSGTSYTATFTASSVAGGISTISIADSAFIDAAGNTNVLTQETLAVASPAGTNGRGTTNNNGTDYIIEQFTTAGNYPWTVPNGVTTVEYIVIGGGGGGAGGGHVAAGNGGGGGGGASGVYRTGTATVTPGDSLTISVGSGGLAGTGGFSGAPSGTQGTTGGTGAQSNAFGVSADGGFGGCASELNASVSSCGYLTKSSGFGGFGGHNIDFSGGARASVAGGGGAGGAGSFGAGGNTSSSTAGVGGSGTTNAFLGSSEIFAAGGNGGAGASGAIAGASGVSRGNGGAGGAGGLNGSAGGDGGAGADGFVAVRYATPAVTTPDMTAQSDTGVSSIDNLTKLSTPTFTGTAVVGASVQLYVDAVASGSPCIANINTGVYTCTTGTLSHGSHSVYAKSTVVLSDGTTQATSLSLTFTVDTVLPIPTLTTGTIQWGENATVQSNELGTAYLVAQTVTVNSLQDILNANGSWWNSVSISAVNTNTTMSTSGLVSDNYRLFVTDAAGNLSDPSTVAVTYVDDTTAPTASITSARIKSPNNAALRSTELGTLYLVRTAVLVHNVLDITRSPNNAWTSAAVVSPNVDVNISVAGLLEGDYVAYAVDRAGNLSSASFDQIVVDNTAPEVTNITSVQNSYAVRNFAAHVSFNEAVVGLTGSDFSNTGTATSCVYTVGAGTNYFDYSVSITCGSDGTVVISLNSNSVADMAGNSGPTTSYSATPINLGANPTKLVLSTPSIGTASGAAFTTQPSITLKNAQDLVVLSYAGTITASITQVNGTGSLEGTTTAAIDTSTGIATFTNLGITGTAGTQYTITYSLGGLTTASQDITVTVGAATKLLMSTQPVGGASGAQFSTQPVIRIADSGNNTVTAGSFSVSVSASTGTIGGTRPKISSNGLATFTDLTFSGLASQSHTFTFTSSGLTQVVSAPFTVTAGAPTQLVLTTQSIGTESGAAFTTQPVLEVRDSGGNKVSGSTASVTASVSAGAILEGTRTVSAVGGVATYSNLGISGTAGTQYTITYSSAGLSSAVQAVTPTVGPASRLSISTQPVGAGAGAQLATQPVVQVVDTGGNVITGSNASIAVTVSAGTLAGTTPITAVSGVGAFTNLAVTGTAANNYRLTFTSLGLTSVISDTFTVSVGVATHLVITTQPVGAGAGQILATQPVVKVLDAGDNIVTGSSASISATASGGWLSGTTTKTSVNGVAAFSNVLFAGTINTDYTLTFAAAGLGTVQSSTFRVTVGPSSQLVVTTAAAGAKYKQAFSTQPVIEVQDAGGNRTSSNATVTATLGAGTVLDASGATMTVNASNGTATFSGLGMIATPGTYNISYSSPSILSTFQSISVAKGDQTVTFGAPADRVFNVASFTLSPTSSSGLTVQLSSTTTSVCTVSGASVTMISIGTCSLTASQVGNTNYNPATDVVQSFVITRATPQITFNTLADKTYGDNSFAVSAAADNPVAISFAGTAGICSVGSSTLTSSTSTATVTILGAGTCTITASRPQDATYESAVAASGSALVRSFTVAKATGTISFNQSTLSQTYDGTARTVTATVNSGTLTITYTGIAPTVYAPSTTAPINAGSYAVVAVQNDGNYQSTLPATLVVEKAVGTITLDATTFSQTYSGTSRSVLVQSTSPAGLNSVLTYTGTNSTTYGPSVFAPTNAGTYTVTAVLNDMNYRGTTTGGLAVALGTQSAITFINGSSTTYNRPINLLAVGGTGTGGMTYATTSGPCTVDANTGTMTPTSSGVCVVVATRAGSGNFGATSSAPLNITIDKAAQTIEFTSTVPARPLPGTTYTPSATVSSGLTPTFTITQGNNTVCSLSNGVITIATSGTCEVSASQVGDNSWLDAPVVKQTMIAGRLNQSISFSVIPTKTFGDPVFSLGATSSSGLVVEYAVISGNASCSVASGGIITLGVIGNCVVEATQPGDAVYSPAVAIQRTITVVPTVPSAPFLSSVSTNDGSVTVAYSAPSTDGGLPVQAYSVKVTNTGTDRSFDVTKTDCTLSLTCVVDGLTNGLSYSVTVTAKNAVGESLPSLASPLVLPILNPQAVRGLTARAGNQTIDVAWNAPASLGGGTFTRYEISIRDRAGTYRTPIVINNYNATSFQFTGLDNGTGYDVKVVTYTTYGLTEFTGNTAEVFEMPRTVPTAPRDVTIAAPTGRLARVSWRVPQSDGGSIITSYVVNAQNYTCVLATPVDIVCEITGLTPGSPLTVQVKAVNSVGQSQVATAAINLPNRPLPPSVSSVVVNSSSAVVNWLPPTSDGGQPLLGYLVYITETGARVNTAQVQTNVPQCSTLQTTCQIDGLDATKKYTFTVRAVNAVGESDASAPFDPFKVVTPTKAPTKFAGRVAINLPVNTVKVPMARSAIVSGSRLKRGSKVTVSLSSLEDGKTHRTLLNTRTIGAKGTYYEKVVLNTSLSEGSYQLTIVAVGENGRKVSAISSFKIPGNWNSLVQTLPAEPSSQSTSTTTTTIASHGSDTTIPGSQGTTPGGPSNGVNNSVFNRTNGLWGLGIGSLLTLFWLLVLFRRRRREEEQV